MFFTRAILLHVLTIRIIKFKFLVVWSASIESREKQNFVMSFKELIMCDEPHVNGELHFLTIGVRLRVCFIEVDEANEANAGTYVCSRKVLKPNRQCTS